jgi:hypothetical protein
MRQHQRRDAAATANLFSQAPECVRALSMGAFKSRVFLPDIQTRGQAAGQDDTRRTGQRWRSAA